MIAWITPRLGTAAYETTDARTGVCVVDVRDLVDKAGNEPEAASAKIDEVLSHLHRGEKVVVCCDYGVSRSNAIAAGALARLEHIPLTDATRRVIAATGKCSMVLDVLATVRRAVEGPPANRSFGGDRAAILVTGGSGFIGSAMVKRLRGRYQVFAPTREEIDLSQGAVELDLALEESGAGVLLHLAAPRIHQTAASMGENLNLLATALEVCRNRGLHLIYMSGAELYAGYRTSGLLMADESLAPRPRGLHSETKYLCGELIRRHQQSGLAASILRTAVLYGEGSRPKFLRAFLSLAQRGLRITTHRYSNGPAQVDLLHIEDLYDAVVACIDHKFVGTLNLGSGGAVSTRKIAEMVISMTGSSSEIAECEILDWNANAVMDYALANRLLDWRPRVSLEDGIRNTVQAFSEEPEAPGATRLASGV